VKRILWLVAVPVGLMAMWGANSARTPERTAEVHITTDQVTALRGSVIARLQTLGATRTGEQTTFDGQGTAQLDFLLPSEKLEESMTLLGQLGGTVTEQTVSVPTAATNQSTNDQLDKLQGCLADVSDGINKKSISSAAAQSDLSACRDRLRQVSADASSALPADAVLRVTIAPNDTTSPWLTLTMIALILGAIFVTVLAVRASKASRTLDLRLDEQLSRTDELYLRRN
jgi:hypothetical protein